MIETEHPKVAFEYAPDYEMIRNDGMSVALRAYPKLRALGRQGVRAVLRDCHWARGSLEYSVWHLGFSYQIRKMNRARKQNVPFPQFKGI